ncbi:TonB-dependent receptor [Sphingobium sp. ba1]|uniref:TonB-dependent receptor n=1 Tax=Sphingobium sp. ba1 TaxID=1522072 RepID=UPI001ED9B539|nr:TonB-dependent receptor [Sphingobium sp. ba1]
MMGKNFAVIAAVSSTAMTMCLWAQGASAQQASAPAPSPAIAPQADAPSGMADIIVTAQKRAQNLQSVPAAISAIGGEELQARGIAQTADLMGSMPNLQVTSAYGDTQPNFSLRGISVANEFSATTASPVGVYVDEVYQSFRASHGQQLYDLERVEVLRGPQGTLYGRNTTGGAINFITRKPGLGDANGYLTLGYGNFNAKTAQGALEYTLIPDELGIRVAGTASKSRGYTFNPTQDQWFSNSNSIAGRASIRWKPSSDLDITLKGYFARNNPKADLAYGIGYLEGRTDATGYSRFVPRPELGGRTLGQNEVQSDTGGNYYTASRGGSLNIKWNLADDISLTSITGYDWGKYRLSPFDCDGSPTNTCAIRYNSTSKNFNQDLRISYDGDRLSLIGGLYHGVDKIDTHNEPDFFGFLRPLLSGAGLPGSFNNSAIAVGNSLRTLPAFALDATLTPSSPGFCAPVVVNPNGFFDARSLVAFNYDVATTNTPGGTAAQAACAAAGALPFGPIAADQRFTLERPSTAIYGEAKFKATEDLSITVGLRYTWDKVKFKNGRTVLYALDGTTPAVGLVPYSNPYNPALPAVNQSNSNGALTGRIVVDYKIAPDILAYASYSRGYRSGTFNGLAYQDISQVYFVDPEKVNAYEGGIKTRFFDRRLQLNLAGFYYDYGKQQIAQIIGATSFLRSANGRVFGAEAELEAKPFENLHLNAALGLLNSKYKGNSTSTADPANTTININGNPFPNAPKMTFSAGFDWTMLRTEANDGKVVLRGDVQYMGRYYFDSFKNYGQDPCNQPKAGSIVLSATPEIACGNPSYWLVNGRLSYETKNYSVSVWAKNITNKFYHTYGLNLNAFYLDYFNRGSPRTFGVEGSVKF